MKILILQDDFPPESFGGAGITGFAFAKALKEKGHAVYVITTVRNRNQEGRGEYRGLKLFKIYSNYHQRWQAYLSLYNPQTAKKVQRIIDDLRPDVVHARNIHYYLSYHCLKLAKASGAKVFFTAHDAMSFHCGKLNEFINPNDLSCPGSFNYRVSWWQQMKKFKKRYNPFRNIIIRYYLKNVRKIFAVSYALKEALEQNGIKSVEVLYNGIDVEEWQISESKIQKFKQKYNLADKKVVLFGGRLGEEKGGRQAVLAMEEVVRKMPDTILLVIGGKNEYAQAILRIAQEKGISRNLVFTDWIVDDELKAAYYVSDVILVPSVYLDPLPRVNLEAMACKKPVVTTCFGGSGEIVRDGISGYIINPYNTRLFSEKVVYLLTNPNKSREMGENGYRIAQEKFSIDVQTKKHLEWYRSV